MVSTRVKFVLAVFAYHGCESVFVNGQVPQDKVKSFTTGACFEYPEDGFCAQFGMGGQRVYIYGDDASPDAFDTRDKELEAFRLPIITAASAVAEPECIVDFSLQMCMGFYPYCDSNDEPLKICWDTCYSLETTCATAFGMARTLNMDSAIPECNTTKVGDTYEASETGIWNHYPESEVDTPLYPKEGDCSSFSGERSLCMMPPECGEPLMFNSFPVPAIPLENEFAEPGDFEYCQSQNYSTFDCERCTFSCTLPCPYPLVYTDSELRLQWAFLAIPGLFAFALNLLVLVSEVAKLRAQKRKATIADFLVFAAALNGIILFFIEGLPALLLEEDVRCNGYEFISVYVNELGHNWCTVGKFRHWFMISLMSTVICNLWKVRKQLLCARNMKKYLPSGVEKAVFAILIIFMPLGLAVGALASEANVLFHQSITYRNEHGDADDADFVSLYHPNAIRGMYGCQFFFNTVTEEYIWYTIPLLCTGLACAVLSVDLLRIVLQMGQGTGTSIRKNKSLITLAFNMLRFAVIAVFLAFLNILANMIYMPKAKDFGVLLEMWSNCLVSGIQGVGSGNGDGTLGVVNTNKTLEAGLEFCGNPKAWAPGSWMLQLLAASQGLPAFAFGFVFALPALKQLRRVAAAKFSSVAPTTSMASSMQ